MKKTGMYLASLALLLSGTFAFSSSQPPVTGQQTKISDVVALGDSLSDGGTYHGLGLPKGGVINGVAYSPAGRFTTNPGKVWVEYLANKYHVILTPNRFTGPELGPNGSFGIVLLNGKDYAEGGAQVVESPGFASYQTNLNGELIDSSGNPLTTYTIQGDQCVPGGTPVSTGITAASIKDQVDRYLTEYPTVPANSLVIIQGGDNDIVKQLYGITHCGSSYLPIAQNNIVAASSQFVQQVNRLISAGARKVLIGTVPDLSVTPFGLATSIDVQTFLTSMSQVFNANIRSYASGNQKVRIADFNQFYSNVLSSPAHYGISVTNTATACNLNGMYVRLAAYIHPDLSLRTVSSLFCNEIDYVTPNAPQTFAFADGVHPTTTLHQQFAQSVYDDLQTVGWK